MKKKKIKKHSAESICIESMKLSIIENKKKLDWISEVIKKWDEELNSDLKKTNNKKDEV